VMRVWVSFQGLLRQEGDSDSQGSSACFHLINMNKTNRAS
jgi:hypothetical protein